MNPLHLIVLAVGVAIGAAVVAWTDRFINADSRWRLTAAQKVREQADEMLADAQTHAMRTEALTTPTGEMPVVRVRLGRRLTEARSWARELFANEQLPDWLPGEIAALPQSQVGRPPLRSRGVLPQARLKWPLRRRRSVPSPAQVAERLSAISDPDRWMRVEVVR